MAVTQTDTVIAELVTRISGDATLSGYTVLGEKQIINSNDIFEDLLSAAIEATGVCIAVMLPVGRNEHQDSGGPVIEAGIVVDIWYNQFHSLAPTNTLMELQEALCQRIHHYLVPEISRAVAVQTLGIKEIDGLLVASVSIDATLAFS